MKGFKGTFGNFVCGCSVGTSLLTTYDVQSLPKAGCATSISSSEGAMLSNPTCPPCGRKFTVRLWLTLGVLGASVEWQVTLPTIWLKHLLAVIATRGGGSGRALLTLGRFLNAFPGKWRGTTKSS